MTFIFQPLPCLILNCFTPRSDKVALYCTVVLLRESFESIFREAIHTHFVTFIGKWTIVGGWVKHRADKRGKVAKLKFVTSP